jgi:hypothetical protein
MKLIFENSYGKERVIANPKNREEVFDEINKFVDECNAKRTDGRPFKIYYINMYMVEDRLKMDIGSHTEFMYVELEKNETWESVNLNLMYGDD